MRIVHVVCSDRFAGVERYLTYVAPALAERRHEVTVIGGESERMTDALDGTGVRFLPARTPIDAGRALLSLRGGVDLVHVHMTDAEFIGVLTRPELRAPVVATLHFAQQRGSSGPRAAVANLVARGLAAQVATSRYVADQAGVASATVVPTGLPWSEPTADREPVVLVAQRLEQEKDGLTAVQAWAASGLADVGWRMVVAGDGAQRSALEQAARQLEVSRSVSFVGNVSDLGARMARAGMLLATTPVEAFGLTVVEAMAAGLPVVAAASGAHLETIGAIDAPALFAPGDAAEAAGLLRRLAMSEPLRASLGDQARARYLQEYTIDRHVDRLLQVYARTSG